MHPPFRPEPGSAGAVLPAGRPVVTGPGDGAYVIRPISGRAHSFTRKTILPMSSEIRPITV